MTKKQFEKAMIDFNAGLVTFNQRADVKAFLYKNHWYPLAALVGYAIDDPKLPTNTARKHINEVIPFIRIKEEVDFRGCNGNPIKLTETERLQELAHLLKQMDDLVK